jgi:hypothetical protein
LSKTFKVFVFDNPSFRDKQGRESCKGSLFFDNPAFWPPVWGLLTAIAARAISKPATGASRVGLAGRNCSLGNQQTRILGGHVGFADRVRGFGNQQARISGQYVGFADRVYSFGNQQARISASFVGFADCSRAASSQQTRTLSRFAGLLIGCRAREDPAHLPDVM